MQTAIGQEISVRELSRWLERFDPDESIEAVLERPESQSFLSSIFDALSPQRKEAARKWIQHARVSSGTTKEKCSPAVAIIRQTTRTELPSEVRELFENCKGNVSFFWQVCIPPTSPISKSTESIAKSVSNVYLDLQNLQRRRRWDIIMWRYYTLFFYDLALLIGNGQERITAKLLKGLLCLLTTSNAITDDVDIIKENVLAWCAIGHRYWKLCKALDDGALFLLPPSSDGLWESESLLSSLSFEQAITALIEAGIRDTSRKIKADTLGSEIRAWRLEPFRWNLSAIQEAHHSVGDGKVERAKKRRLDIEMSRGVVCRKSPGKKNTVLIPSQLDLLYEAAIFSDQQRAVASAVENGRNLDCFPGNSGAATNQTIPSRAVSAPDCLSPRQTGPPRAELTSKNVCGNEPGDTVFQPPEEPSVDWTIPTEFVHGRPTTGEEAVGMEGWLLPEEESWFIPANFVDGRQETVRFEDWAVPADFLSGRPTTGHETGGPEAWPGLCPLVTYEDRR